MFSSVLLVVLLALAAQPLVKSSTVTAERYYCYKKDGSTGSKSGQCLNASKQAELTCPEGTLFVPDESQDHCSNGKFFVSGRGFRESTTTSGSVAMTPYVECKNPTWSCRTNTAKLSGVCCMPSSHSMYASLKSEGSIVSEKTVACQTVTKSFGQKTCYSMSNTGYALCGAKSFIRSVSCSNTNSKMTFVAKGQDQVYDYGTESDAPKTHDELLVNAFCDYTSYRGGCIQSTTTITAECCSYL